MNALTVVVLAKGDHGAVAVQETVARDAAMRKVNARVVADQEMLPLAVALREVWPYGRCSWWPWTRRR